MARKPRTAPTLTFKQFRSFYDMNPDRWVLHPKYVQILDRPFSQEQRVRCFRLLGRGVCAKYVDPTTECEYKDVYFATRSDLLEYRKWRRHEDDRKEILKAVENTEQMLKWVHEDLKEQHQKVAATAAAAREEALKNMVVGV